MQNTSTIRFSPPVRVLVVDDHAPTLAAVADMLGCEAPSIEVVGTADGGETALRMADEAAPDVIVLDLDLGRENGLDLIAQFHPGCGRSIVVFSANDDFAMRQRAVLAGAAAFVSKLAPISDLISAVLDAHQLGLAWRGDNCHGVGEKN